MAKERGAAVATGTPDDDSPPPAEDGDIPGINARDPIVAVATMEH